MSCWFGWLVGYGCCVFEQKHNDNINTITLSVHYELVRLHDDESSNTVQYSTISRNGWLGRGARIKTTTAMPLNTETIPMLLVL